MLRKPAQDFVMFLLGGALFASGIFLFSNQVMVGSGSVLGFGGFFSFGSGQGFGLLMLPFGLGVAFLLAGVNRRLGWLLVLASASALGVAVLQSMLFSFRPVSLWSLASMVMMVAGGAGLMFKSLSEYQGEERGRVERDLEDSRQHMSDLRQELEALRARLDNDGRSSQANDN